MSKFDHVRGFPRPPHTYCRPSVFLRVATCILANTLFSVGICKTDCLRYPSDVSDDPHWGLCKGSDCALP